jgi:hypothetical protein
VYEALSYADSKAPADTAKDTAAATTGDGKGSAAAPNAEDKQQPGTPKAGVEKTAVEKGAAATKLAAE